MRHHTLFFLFLLATTSIPTLTRAAPINYVAARGAQPALYSRDLSRSAASPRALDNPSTDILDRDESDSDVLEARTGDGVRDFLTHNSRNPPPPPPKTRWRSLIPNSFRGKARGGGNSDSKAGSTHGATTQLASDNGVGGFPTHHSRNPPPPGRARRLLASALRRNARGGGNSDSKAGSTHGATTQLASDPRSAHGAPHPHTTQPKQALTQPAPKNGGWNWNVFSRTKPTTPESHPPATQPEPKKRRLPTLKQLGQLMLPHPSLEAFPQRKKAEEDPVLKGVAGINDRGLTKKNPGG
ncbi:hypothetical protein DACRYDRAFT_112730 [Dacryopinax primogenitus]|uniref:Uncharacterized protein n=1 Tax=Dacryopinax primogenitus (strain DJM 731) TaxID=1858805 RepID=M5FNN2_DACPD|nr:uncharacterized protein DACRYDRAFT_112730 [Dacryopinax primogenitus]EJT96473.1 hypothetical protein DACRYDRAFT_112730 [Dacryopinax primogenitus]